jgi:CRP/FNR family transcriptional regulator, cyclic AMP receptor protein
MRQDRRSRNESDLKRFVTGRGGGQSRLQPAPGEIVWTQGEPGDALYYIEKGWIKVSVVSRSGKEALIALPGEGELIGTRCLIEGYRRIGTAVTLGECSLIRITKAALIRLLHQEPDFAETLLICVVAQSLRALRTFAEQLTDTSESRLARMLLRLASSGGNQKSRPLLVPVSQSDLANMIGTTRGRVSYFMNKFRKQSFIDYNRQGYVTVHSRLAKTLVDS